MNKNKIIIFAPILGGGGVEKNLFLISNYLVNKFENVSIITTSSEFAHKFNKRVNLIAPKKKIWNKIKSRRLKIFICLLLLVKSYLSNKKISVLSFQGNLYCCLLCKFLKIRILLRSNASITGWSKGFLKRILYKKISKLADKIIVNSYEFQKQYKREFGINTLCIYNPLNKNKIITESKKKINFNFFKKSTVNFINVGRLVDQKDHITLLKAFLLLKNKFNFKFRLLIIGKGSNKILIQNFIKKNKLTRNIKILTFKNNPYPYIKKADISLLTSIFEGLPNILLESLALKKVVISSDCPTGPKEILDNGKGGLLFKMKDHHDLVKKVVFYLNNKKSCEKMTKYGNKRLHRFDYNSNLNKYFKLLKN